MNEKHTKTSFLSLPSEEIQPSFNQHSNEIGDANASSQGYLQNIIPNDSILNEEHSLAHLIASSNVVERSSKKKKRGCTCKKTNCLKMYCQCFSQGNVCGEECVCTDCKNCEDCHEQLIAAKLGIKKVGQRNSSLAQKQCNCKKSQCLKKYCECYNSGMKCSTACKCIDCMNIKTNGKNENNQKQASKIEDNQADAPQLVQDQLMFLYKSIDDLQNFCQ